MQTPQPSSNSDLEPTEAGLAVLVAYHQRGPLTLPELSRLLAGGPDYAAEAGILTARGLLETQGDRFALTQKGRDLLDGVLESIERRLSPDAPEYVRRYRRAAPTIPFDTNTVWEEAVAVNLRVDPPALRRIVPDAFDLDLYKGNAFVSLTVSRLKDFGLGRLPRALRTNFYQATYRAHVTYTDFRGRTTKGCFFVRSETNSSLMSLSANLLPEFRAHRCGTCPMLMARKGEYFVLTVDSEADPAGKVVLLLDTARPRSAMPADSIFPSIDVAYDFLVDFRDAFSYNSQTGEVYILEIQRGDWKIKVVDPVDSYFGYLTHGPLGPGAAQLDSVFYFTGVPYRWLPLLKEKLRHGNR